MTPAILTAMFDDARRVNERASGEIDAPMEEGDISDLIAIKRDMARG